MAQGQAGGTPPSDANAHQGEGAPAPVFRPPRQPFLEVLGSLTQRRTVVLGVAGVIIFFAVWEVAHYVTPEEKQRFLPAVEQVVALGCGPSSGRTVEADMRRLCQGLEAGARREIARLEGIAGAESAE